MNQEKVTSIVSGKRFSNEFRKLLRIESLFSGKTVLATGGTGSFGNTFAELPQVQIRCKLNDDHRVRLFIGDVSSKELRRGLLLILRWWNNQK